MHLITIRGVYYFTVYIYQWPESTGSCVVRHFRLHREKGICWATMSYNLSWLFTVFNYKLCQDGSCKLVSLGDVHRSCKLWMSLTYRMFESSSVNGHDHVTFVLVIVYLLYRSWQLAEIGKVCLHFMTSIVLKQINMGIWII